MHPTIVRDSNKEKCPICFMPLSKRKKGEVGGGKEALPAGTVARVQLSPCRIVLAGVRTGPVEYHTLSRDITTVGTVEFDERQMKIVSARVKGRIDTLRVNQTGQMVHAGDPLAELYSPDLVVTVQNLLDARQSAGNAGPGKGERPRPAQVVGNRRRAGGGDREGRQADHAPDDPLADHGPRPQEVRPRRTVRRGGRTTLRRGRSHDGLDSGATL